jgi:hypothetical protein
LWTGALIGAGYGGIGITGRSMAQAHRVSWELHHGPIPAGMWVLHHCDVRTCVNPAHLFLGNQADNMKDAAIKGRIHPTRLSESDVRWLREWRAAGWKVRHLAPAVGCCESHVSAICLKQERRHVPMSAPQK